MPGAFTYKPSSPYDDVPGERYHFPISYLSRVEKLVGDWVVFHELKDKGRGANAYVSFARVKQIDADPLRSDRFYARLSDAGTFARPVPIETSGRALEPGVQTKVRNAVRIFDTHVFQRILMHGDAGSPDNAERFDGLEEDAPPFVVRDVSETIRVKRASWFRERVLSLYDDRCALTGLRLVNGGGAAEVDAAHIKGVGEGGPDLVTNGLALSRTVHWMFDRRLITFNDDLSLVRTPMLDPIEATRVLGNVSALQLPPRMRQDEVPSRAFLKHHREATFAKVRDQL